jgi:hypothetical protein
MGARADTRSERGNDKVRIGLRKIFQRVERRTRPVRKLSPCIIVTVEHHAQAPSCNTYIHVCTTIISYMHYFQIRLYTTTACRYQAKNTLQQTRYITSTHSSSSSSSSMTGAVPRPLGIPLRLPGPPTLSTTCGAFSASTLPSSSSLLPLLDRDFCPVFRP